MRSDEITRHDPDTIRFDDTIALGDILGFFFPSERFPEAVIEHT